MTRRAIIIASFIGLACAIVETGLIPGTLQVTDTALLSILVAVLTVAAAAIAGRTILGTTSVHRYYRLGVPLLSAISGLAFESAVTNWLIARQVSFGPAPTAPSAVVVLALVIGALAYLGAATVYGFAGTRQGITIGSRIGLLLLLLLAVLPGLNVLGLAGFVATAFVRKAPTPAPAGASE
jgi:hypothetical protein